MKVKCWHNDTIAEVCIGKKSIRSVEDKIKILRLQCGQDSDILTALNVFLANTHRWNTVPIVVLLHRDTTLYGAVLFHGGKKFGLPTGVLSAGHLCGRGTAIAIAAARPGVVEIAARILIRSFLAHTVTIRLLRCDLTGHRLDQIPSHATDDRWLLREMGSRITLADGMDGLMAQLSHKMRRNLRYYRRRSEKELGCVFLPHLSAAESRAAVEALHGSATFPISASRALAYEAALRESPNSFAMGLQDSAGNWLSLLAGWRCDKTIYIEWQLNLADQKTASLSNVMRFYCLEHEAGQGTTEVIFVGGTTPAWNRAFVPQICSDLLVCNRFVSLVARGLDAWQGRSAVQTRRSRSVRRSIANMHTRHRVTGSPAPTEAKAEA